VRYLGQRKVTVKNIFSVLVCLWFASGASDCQKMKKT